jgi:hypothetical protein
MNAMGWPTISGDQHNAHVTHAAVAPFSLGQIKPSGCIPRAPGRSHIVVACHPAAASSGETENLTTQRDRYFMLSRRTSAPIALSRGQAV